MRVGMDMPGQHRAGREGIGLRVDLLAGLAGHGLGEELLRGDGALAVGLARKHIARRAGETRQKHDANDPIPQSHGFTPSRPRSFGHLAVSRL